MTGKPFFPALQALVTKTNSFTAGEAETAFAQSYWSQQLYLVHRANTHCKTQRKEKNKKTTVCQRNVLFVFKYSQGYFYKLLERTSLVSNNNSCGHKLYNTKQDYMKIAVSGAKSFCVSDELPAWSLSHIRGAEVHHDPTRRGWGWPLRCGARLCCQRQGNYSSHFQIVKKTAWSSM